MSLRLLAATMSAFALLAQDKPAVAKPALPPPGPKPRKIGPVTVQGSIRSRTEVWDWFQPNSGDPGYSYSGNIARLSFTQSLEHVDWQAEIAVPMLFGLPRTAVGPGAQGQLGIGAAYFAANDGNRNSVGIFPKQAFLRFKNLGGNAANSVRVGRFEFMDGSEIVPKNATLMALKRDRINMRLLGHFGWAHVGRSFDGAHYAYAKPTTNFTLLAATPARGVFQTDGAGWNKAAFGYTSFTKDWGSKSHAADTRVFFLQYRDWRGVLKTDSRAVAARRADASDIDISTFGGHTVHAFDTARAVIDLLFWGAAQTGSWGAQTHRAHAFAVEAGIQPKVAKALKPWFRGGFYDGSGDGNAADGKHGTFFQVLPTPRPFARFPFFNMMNNRDIMGAMILRPHAKVTISNEFHSLGLSNRNDLWYSGGGVFQPWTFGYAGRAANGAKSLANLYDMSVEYRMSPLVTLTGYFGHAQGLAAARSIYPRGKNGNFGYMEVNYKF